MLMQKPFSYEWTAYPASLFTPNDQIESGFAMRKGNKSDFLAALLGKIDGSVTTVSSLPESSFSTVYLIDAMAFVQKYQTLKGKRCEDLPRQYISTILQLKPEQCDCINIVGDRYDFSPAESLKGHEREKRDAKHLRTREYVLSDAIAVPDWKELMSNADNKARLLSYLSKFWCQHSEESIPKGITFMIGGTFEDRAKAVALRSGSMTSLEMLSCEEHEEADTRIIAHLFHCADTLQHRRAVIARNYTDIIVLCMYHFCHLPLEELWIQRNDTFFPIRDIVRLLSEKVGQDPREVVSTLLCGYVLSGCDTCSYPYRRGKCSAALVSLSLVGSLTNMAEIGKRSFLALDNVLLNEARLFFLSLYWKSDFNNLDLLRQHMFASNCQTVRCRLGDTFASFLPGISITLGRIITADIKQGQAVTITALEVWYSVVKLVMEDCQLEKLQATEKSNHNVTVSEKLQELIVRRTSSWVDQTSSKLSVIITHISTIRGHSKWKVRACLVEWASCLLNNCSKSLKGSVPTILEILVGLVNDEYPRVASKSRDVVEQFSSTSTGANQRPLVEILEENLHGLSLSLPRFVRATDEDEKLGHIQLLAGYLTLLGPNMKSLLVSLPHLKRLSLALVQALELDCTDIKIVEEKNQFSGQGAASFEKLGRHDIIKPRKYFKHIHSEVLIQELQNVCRLLGYYGNLHILTDQFLNMFCDCTHKMAATLILNEIMLGAAGMEVSIPINKTDRSHHEVEDLENVVR
ncbi:hypothetical protein ScPMuIL_009536 [Solemya velum]